MWKNNVKYIYKLSVIGMVYNIGKSLKINTAINELNM